MTTWAEFHPLKSCVIGTLPNAEDILPYTKLENRYRGYFKEIVNRSKVELDNLEKVLKDFGVETHRSIQSYPMHNGKTINTPPLAVRDFFTVYGNNLFKGNFAYEWNKQVPESCDHLLQNIKFDSTFELPTDNIFFNGDFSIFDPEKDLPRPYVHPPIALKCGNDIIVSKTFGKEGNKLGYKKYVEWFTTINPSVRFHVVDTESHLDSQIFLVRPGLMITSLPDSSLPGFFDKWDRIHVESVTAQLFHKRSEHRHKKFHPVIAQSFYNFLETCTEETYFNINSMSINESTVLFTGTHPALFNKLEKRGVDCVPISMKATTFWDTGVHCASNELERQGALEDYA